MKKMNNIIDLFKEVIYIGIVGSRLRTEKAKIRKILFTERLTHGNIVAVSGGANGIDGDVQWGCRALGIPILIYYPNKDEYEIKGDDIYFERNKLIAIKSDYLYAFPLYRKGGAMNTIKFFRELGKKERLKIID